MAASCSYQGQPGKRIQPHSPIDRYCLQHDCSCLLHLTSTAETWGLSLKNGAIDRVEPNGIASRSGILPTHKLFHVNEKAARNFDQAHLIAAVKLYDLTLSIRVLEPYDDTAPRTVPTSTPSPAIIRDESNPIMPKWRSFHGTSVCCLNSNE